MKYDFYIDTKHTVWMRSHHSIEASNEEEAKEHLYKILKEVGAEVGEQLFREICNIFEFY